MLLIDGSHSIHTGYKIASGVPLTIDLSYLSTMQYPGH